MSVIFAGQARPGWLVAGEERVLHHDAGFKVSPVSAAPPRFWRQNLPSILYLASTSTQYAAPTLPSHQCTLGHHKLYSLGELIVRHTPIHSASAYLAHVYLINIFHTHINKQKSSMLCQRQNHELYFVEYIIFCSFCPQITVLP